MSILDQSIRSMVDSCDEALDDCEREADPLHRMCSRDTLDDTDDEILEVNPVCYSTDNLLASSSSMQLRPGKGLAVSTTKELADTEEDDNDSEGLADYREKMVSYEVNYHTDSEDDDDVYVPDWKVYEEFQSGVLEDDVMPIKETSWMRSTDQLATDEQAAAAAEWDVQRRMGRKRHYRLAQMSSDLEDLVKQLEVIPAKIRRMDKDEPGAEEEERR